MLSNVQWKKLWMSSIWHEEKEGMCTGYRYGTAFCDVEQCTVGKVMDVIYMAWRIGRHVYWILIWNCLLWCWAMYSGKSYGCHPYGMKNRKACVLDLDKKLPSVMSCKVLCRYVDTICGVWYLSILCTFCIAVISNNHVPNPWHNFLTYSTQHSAA